MFSRRKLPDELSRLIDGYRWRRIEIGESGAEVYRLTAKEGPSLILKHARDNTSLSLGDEAARLRWLSQHANVPSVLWFAAEGDGRWLLMTTLPGTNAEDARVPATIKVRLVAEALRALHAIDRSACPFDERLDAKIARAAENVRQGRVEEAHFDEKNLGRSAADLFSEMLSKRPTHEDLVVTHGDACFPNFMLDGATFTGFVDCGRAGVADRYQDLALICRSIEYELGTHWVARFFRHYGLDTLNQARLDFYRLLDEFS